MLLAGHETRDSTWCWRPAGTSTPLLVHTRAGAGLIKLAADGAEHRLTAGDTVVWAPGTAHDFGCTDADGGWEILWAHYVSRGDRPAWTSWLKVAPGVRWVPAPDTHLLGRIDDALMDSVAAAQGATAQAARLAVNALSGHCSGLKRRHLARTS